MAPAEHICGMGRTTFRALRGTKMGWEFAFYDVKELYREIEMPIPYRRMRRGGEPHVGIGGRILRFCLCGRVMVLVVMGKLFLLLYDAG